MDYRNRKRLKIWGRALVVEDDSSLAKQLEVPDYEAQTERAILFQVEAWNWNCPQHIPIRYSEAFVKAMLAPLCDRITQLEERIAQLQSSEKV